MHCLSVGMPPSCVTFVKVHLRASLLCVSHSTTAGMLWTKHLHAFDVFNTSVACRTCNLFGLHGGMLNSVGLVVELQGKVAISHNDLQNVLVDLHTHKLTKSWGTDLPQHPMA